MNEHDKEATRASREAERDLTAHSERPIPHAEAISRFVGANLYDETRVRKERAARKAKAATAEAATTAEPAEKTD